MWISSKNVIHFTIVTWELIPYRNMKLIIFITWLNNINMRRYGKLFRNSWNAYEYIVVGGGIFKHVYILCVALLDVSVGASRLVCYLIALFLWECFCCWLQAVSVTSIARYTTSLKTTYKSKRFISKQNLILVHQLWLWFNLNLTYKCIKSGFECNPVSTIF